MVQRLGAKAEVLAGFEAAELAEVVNEMRLVGVAVGKRNIYGHPSPEVIDRINMSGARVLRTDRDGAVICRSDGVTVRVERMVK